MFFQEMDIHLSSAVVAFVKCFPLNLVSEENIKFINSNVIEYAKKYHAFLSVKVLDGFSHMFLTFYK